MLHETTRQGIMPDRHSKKKHGHLKGMGQQLVQSDRLKMQLSAARCRAPHAAPASSGTHLLSALKHCFSQSQCSSVTAATSSAEIEPGVLDLKPSPSGPPPCPPRPRAPAAALLLAGTPPAAAPADPSMLPVAVAVLVFVAVVALALSQRWPDQQSP